MPHPKSSTDRYDPPQARAISKKALLIAMEYRARPNPEISALDGLHKHLQKFKSHLIYSHGYAPDNISVMKDDGSLGGPLYPSKDNIFREIQTLVRTARFGDSRLLYLAGHGTQLMNQTGSEDDGLDEAIVTARNTGWPRKDVGYESSASVLQGIIRDNEFRQILINKMPPGSNLVIIVDACHSGTMFDLPFRWHGTGTRFETIECQSSLPYSFGTISADRRSQNIRSHSVNIRDDMSLRLGARELDRARPLRVRSKTEYPRNLGHRAATGSEFPPALEQASYQNPATRNGDGSILSPTSLEGPLLYFGSPEPVVHDLPALNDVSGGVAGPSQMSSTTNRRSSGLLGSEAQRSPAVICLSSSEDNQITRSTAHESMTTTLIQILEQHSQAPVTWKFVTEELNRRMARFRRNVLNTNMRFPPGAREVCLRRSDRLQYPQLSAMHRNAKDQICRL